MSAFGLTETGASEKLGQLEGERFMAALAWLQETGFSIWLRESSWAIFAVLILHTLGMGFLVGTGAAIGLRGLGVARTISMAMFARFLPLIWAALALAVVSGVLLVIGYPAKALTNPLFYAKLVILAAAFELSRRMLRHPPSAALAAASLTLWAAGLTAGKFLAYTHKMLLVY